MKGWIRRQKDEPNFGFTLASENYLRHYDNPQKNPTLAVFNGEIEDEDYHKTRYCPNCSSGMKWIQQIRQWSCINCPTFVNTEFDKDATLAINKPGDISIPIDQRGPYAQADIEEERPYFRSINPDLDYQENLPYEITYESADKRIAHIKMKDGHSPTEYEIHRDLQGGDNY